MSCTQPDAHLGNKVLPEFFLRNNTLDQLPEWLIKNKGAGDIIIYINCLGGDVLSAIESVNLIKSHPGKVTTIINGCAESSALLIAISGHERIIYSNSWGMTHPFSTTIEGNYYDHKDASKHNDILHKTMIDIFRSNSVASREVINYRLLGRVSTWLTAMEMLELGMVDVVLELPNPRSSMPRASN